MTMEELQEILIEHQIGTKDQTQTLPCQIVADMLQDTDNITPLPQEILDVVRDGKFYDVLDRDDAVGVNVGEWNLKWNSSIIYAGMEYTIFRIERYTPYKQLFIWIYREKQ